MAAMASTTGRHDQQPPPSQPSAPTQSTTVASNNRRTASIANLLLPPTQLAERNLLSLSHLASTMQPAEQVTSPSLLPSPTTAASTDLLARTKSVPVINNNNNQNRDNPVNLTPMQISPPPPQRHTTRLSRTTSIAATPLGVAHSSQKKMSRTKSGFSGRRSTAALRAAVSAESSSDANNNNNPTSNHSNPPPTPNINNTTPLPPVVTTPSPAVLRPISSNPLPSPYKHTSASNSVDSCININNNNSNLMATMKKDVFQAAAMRIRHPSHHIIPNPSTMVNSMDIEIDQREPSSSSHDAKLMSRPSRSRTTPDAKRAQNRESAKRFRVAQKKRWAELQETVERKEEEINKLKNMLQEVTNQNLASRVNTTPKTPNLKINNNNNNLNNNNNSNSSSKIDSLTMAELDLFVKLMCCSPNDPGTAPTGMAGAKKPQQMPLAANIGSLYRVIVSKLDGSVLGIRHQNDTCGKAMGGEVGGCIWEHVHSSDSAHLRFTIVHAAKMASVMDGEPAVFSYRRRALVQNPKDDEQVNYMRMKGCVYPLADENGEINAVILAEFIEL